MSYIRHLESRAVITDNRLGAERMRILRYDTAALSIYMLIRGAQGRVQASSLNKRKPTYLPTGYWLLMCVESKRALGEHINMI